jgi:hypothetical protein
MSESECCHAEVRIIPIEDMDNPFAYICEGCQQPCELEGEGDA